MLLYMIYTALLLCYGCCLYDKSTSILSQNSFRENSLIYTELLCYCYFIIIIYFLVGKSCPTADGAPECSTERSLTVTKQEVGKRENQTRKWKESRKVTKGSM